MLAARMMPPIAAIAARDHEDEDADPRDVDACAPGGLGIAAHGVDVTAEGRPLGEERQDDEEDDDQDAGQRETERRSLHLRVVADGDGSEGGDGDPDQLGDDEPRVSGSRPRRAACCPGRRARRDA